MAVGRLSSILMDQKNEHELYRLLKEVISGGFEHPEVSYYMGASCWALAKRNEAVVDL